MPFPLHKSPAGLLELLRLRTLGRQPGLFSEQVSSVVESTEFYAADLVINGSEDGAAGAINQTFLGAAAPTYRRYLGLSGQLIMGAAAGTVISVGIGFRSPAAAANVAWGTLNLNTPVAAMVYRVHAQFPIPLVLPPGSQPMIQTSGNAAGADHVLQLRYCFHNLDGR